MKLAAWLVLLVSLACAQTQVVMLGSGNPNADPDRSGPAEAVVVNGTAYLVDCGPGVVRRAALAARQDGIPALRVAAITHLFVTHLHSDHTLGYPDLIFSPWVLGRQVPLQAYGPAGLQAMTRDILHAWSKDIAVRTQGLEHANLTGYHVEVHEISPGEIYHDANVTITAFLVHHGSWDQAFGYRFQTADRTIVFSGDTSPVAAVAQACDGCDLLFDEVYNQDGKMTPAWRQYMEAFHTSARELGAIATAAHPKLLVLYHQMPEGTSPSALLAQVRRYYHGPVVSARDLDIY
ncbi:MAG TPA: MBL fold metallo-hydrolase [Terriglobales bacterium]|nr:MBL fold metallo-hydrolase [Terriglobales bacterium]